MTFSDFLRDLGLRPRAIVADGRIRRCPTEDHPRKRNGAYKLTADGFGWAQNHATMTAPAVWKQDGTRLPPVDLAGLRRDRENARRELLRATLRARRFWANCEHLRANPLHPYLEAHGLDMTGCSGLRIAGGWLVVPLFRRGSLVSYQRIAPDGSKLFAKGCGVRGGSYRIERHGSTVTVLAEGLATGLAIYACVRQASVVVAFNAGNLVRVAAELPRRGLMVVCADNDTETAERIGRNPGVESARAAAEVIGCKVAIPECTEGGSDFCDLRMERLKAGLEAWNRPPHRSAIAVRNIVDAGIAREVMRQAVFVYDQPQAV